MLKTVQIATCVLMALLAIELAPNSATAAHAPPTAQLQGVVRGPTGLPVGGIQVTLSHAPHKGKHAAGQGAVIQTVTAGSNGMFVFPNVPRGRYVLAASANGRQAQVHVRFRPRRPHSIILTLHSPPKSGD